MEIILNEKQIEELRDNKIIGNLILKNASIEFSGKNNILFCNKNIEIKNCKIRFTGSDSLIYFDENKGDISLNIRVGNDSVFYLGKNCYINKTSNMYATERKNIIIGSDCLISFDSYFRTADPHIIYDVKSKKRINFSKSILIGDHVWIGQNCLILKGTKVGSGSVIGGHSVVSNKIINSNTIYAGNPAKKVKENISYLGPYSTHNYTLEEEKNSNLVETDNYTYQKDENTVNLSKIDNDLLNLSNVLDKLDYINNNISQNQSKNRFYIGD